MPLHRAFPGRREVNEVIREVDAVEGGDIPVAIRQAALQVAVGVVEIKMTVSVAGTQPHERAVVEVRQRAAGEVVEARLRSEEHTSELQSRGHLVCRLLLEKKKVRQH